jgi:dolichyl-phosphate-mannose--protein O-mannosyl transferase
MGTETAFEKVSLFDFYLNYLFSIIMRNKIFFLILINLITFKILNFARFLQIASNEPFKKQI